MQTAQDKIAENLGLPKGSRGRKDGNGTPAVIKLESLKTKEDHLVRLCTKADEAATDYKEAVNKVAEAAGLNAATVNKYIKAKVGEKFDEVNQKIQQLALVFEECGGGEKEVLELNG